MAVRPKIRKQLHRLEQSTEELFDLLKQYPAEQIAKRPSPGNWNALETLNHIYLAEKLSLQYVRFKVTRPGTIPGTGPFTWCRSLLVKLALMSPLKFKAPTAIDMRNAQPVLALEELHSHWGDLRKELTGFLEQQEEHFKKQRVYKHHVAGRLTLRQMLVFFQDHLRHHTTQINRILANVRDSDFAAIE